MLILKFIIFKKIPVRVEFTVVELVEFPSHPQSSAPPPHVSYTLSPFF